MHRQMLCHNSCKLWAHYSRPFSLETSLCCFSPWCIKHRCALAAVLCSVQRTTCSTGSRRNPFLQHRSLKVQWQHAYNGILHAPRRPRETRRCRPPWRDRMAFRFRPPHTKLPLCTHVAFAVRCPQLPTTSLAMNVSLAARAQQEAGHLGGLGRRSSCISGRRRVLFADYVKDISTQAGKCDVTAAITAVPSSSVSGKPTVANGRHRGHGRCNPRPRRGGGTCETAADELRKGSFWLSCDTGVKPCDTVGPHSITGCTPCAERRARGDVVPPIGTPHHGTA